MSKRRPGCRRWPLSRRSSADRLRPGRQGATLTASERGRPKSVFPARTHSPTRRRTTMTKLPAPEQWVLQRMNEMETAEMIERHIDYYVEHPDGEIESVHLPMAFVRHFMRRDDDDLPRIVAIATAPLVLADGHLLAPVGLDRLRGIQFEIPKELRAIIPKKVTDKDVREAMKFLLNEWLVDVTTDFAGKCIVLAAAMSIIEHTLL